MPYGGESCYCGSTKVVDILGRERKDCEESKVACKNICSKT